MKIHNPKRIRLPSQTLVDKLAAVMKIRASWLMVPAVVLSLGACGEKEKGKTPAKPTAVESTPPPVAPPATAPAAGTPASPATVAAVKLTVEERAAKLGFIKHLPQDTEIVMSFHNGAKSVDRMKSSKLWKLVESEMGMGMGMEPPDGGEAPMLEDDLKLPEDGDEGTSNSTGVLDPSAPMLITTDGPDPEAQEAIGAATTAGEAIKKDGEETVEEVEEEIAGPMSPSALFGSEFTIALGKSVGEQTGNLLKTYSRVGYFQMRTLAKAFSAAAKSGDFSGMEEAMDEQYGAGLVKDLLTDPESGIAMLERMKMPPLYLAFRTTGKDRPAADQQIAALIANLVEMDETFEPIKIEKAGSKFEGVKVSGTKVSESINKNREDMEEMLDAATIDKLIAAVAKHDLVIASGILGDYVVLFIGASTDDLKFAENPAQSLAGSDALAFFDSYVSKDLAAVIYGEKASLEKMTATAGGLADIAAGLRDGLSGAEGVGDTRDLEALLRMVGERETALKKLASHETLGTVAFFEEGFKIESVGGTDSGAIDWKSPNKLAALGDSDDVVLFANMTADAAYDEKMRAYLEVLTETAYAMSLKVSELPMEDESIAQFKEMTKLFDGKFRKDAVALWDTFNQDFSGSIGKECALIVDLKGSMPTIPGIPQAIVNDGKCPRIAMITPVTDRAKLSSSWDKMNATTTSILAKISEMADQEIPMQKPMSSEKNGCTTWFFAFPFINDDFVPSVTVGDKWFAASTSKNQALDLIAKAEKGGDTRTGFYLAMNFKALQKFSKETLKMVGKNSGNLLGTDGPSTDDMGKIGKVIEAMDDLDKLTVHARREGGAMRTSIHFKTR